MSKLMATFKTKVAGFDPQKLPSEVKPLLDIIAWLLAVLIAYLMVFVIRYDAAIPLESYPGLLLSMFALTTAKLVGARILHLHKQSWSHLSFRDLGAILRLVISVGVIGSALLLLFGPVLKIPRSVAALDMLLSLLFMVGLRSVARYWHENWLQQGVVPARRKKVLIIGAEKCCATRRWA